MIRCVILTQMLEPQRAWKEKAMLSHQDGAHGSRHAWRLRAGAQSVELQQQIDKILQHRGVSNLIRSTGFMAVSGLFRRWRRDVHSRTRHAFDSVMIRFLQPGKQSDADFCPIKQRRDCWSRNICYSSWGAIEMASVPSDLKLVCVVFLLFSVTVSLSRSGRIVI